ncbi:TetR/AcrR family transcriptional regulator [Neomegalonema sp.]|uniref:TetR/AcrR family transcriptional regulator n=1 Tax=Neomegalonema sp. TaxID=2039713 RepID=UPI002609FC2D|nr:TetR/AcrR family transcriptional regulator [Neomegalonema sp.]MDD2868327.1 TetR/AcrR family transcriptional regulator [Neomegalonema sp.]
MARQRKISADDILDATERVILRLGPVGMSIDAVAREAAVSKSRVVYDHKSKSELLMALMSRHHARHEADQEKAVADHADSPHPELFGRIAMAERAPDDTERAVFMAVNAAMPCEVEIQAKIREWVRKDMADIRKGERPHAATMALLALSGLCWTEFSGVHEWSARERRRILDGIRMIFATLPEPAPEPESEPEPETTSEPASEPLAAPASNAPSGSENEG